MALQDIVNVSISLDTASVSRASFGTPIFIGEHNYFTERVRSYSDITDVALDFPADSNEYVAAQGFFSQSPAPSLIKIGRQDTDLVTITPAAATSIGQVYAVTVVGTDSSVNTVSFTTVTGNETAEDIATILVAALGAVAGVTITDTTGAYTLAKSGTEAFVVKDVTLSAITYTTTETAPEVLSACSLEDDGFYFVTAHDHTETFVLAMAAAVEAATKIYFVSNQEATSIATLAAPATDTLGKLTDFGYLRTSALFSHDADTNFPECAAVAIAAVSTPGTKVWGVNRISGVPVGQNPTTGNVLNNTELNNLNDRNANFVVLIAGTNAYRTGKVSGNEWIDAIRNRDFMEARLTEGLQNKLIASPVVPYTDSGINEIRSTVTSVLNTMVSTSAASNILTESNSYTTSFPRAIDVPTVDKQNRVLNASFTATLAGAIQIVNIEGSLSLEAQ